MKKHIVVLLMLVSVRLLVADTMTLQERSPELSPSAGEVAPSMRVITESEFEGKVPIVIHINESLVVPLHYEQNTLTNSYQFLYGPQGSDKIDIFGDGGTWSSSDYGVTFDLNLICTGKKVGPAVVLFGDGGEIMKELSVQIVE